MTFNDASMLFDFADESMAACGTETWTVMCKLGDAVIGFPCYTADDVYTRVCLEWRNGAEVWIMPR